MPLSVVRIAHLPPAVRDTTSPNYRNQENAVFKSVIRNPRKVVVWESEGSFATEEEAVIAAFAARPRAGLARVVDAETGVECPVPYHRMYVIRRVALRDGVDALPESLREEAASYANPMPVVVGEATSRVLGR
jgi:hypothetical protein